MGERGNTLSLCNMARVEVQGEWQEKRDKSSLTGGGGSSGTRAEGEDKWGSGSGRRA